MSAGHPHPAAPARNTTAAHAVDHPTVGTYVKVAVVLGVVTALEVAVVFVRQLAPIIVPLLLGMAIAKFALVAMFFMHLRYDNKLLTTVFVGPLIIAVGLGVALMSLAGAFLVFGR